MLSFEPVGGHMRLNYLKRREFAKISIKRLVVLAALAFALAVAWGHRCVYRDFTFNQRGYIASGDGLPTITALSLAGLRRR
jgi:hypothetical protein